MSWVYRGFSYCRQVATRLSIQPSVLSHTPQTTKSPQLQCVRSCQTLGHPSEFKVKSPYRKPGPRAYGYKQNIFDGGPLPRGLTSEIETLKPYRPRKNWSEKQALFGRNDYIDILGDSNLKPVDLLRVPRWLKGFNGNEMQRIIRRMKYDTVRLQQLYPSFYKDQQKRIGFLYKKYNQRRGKRHT